MQVLGGEHRRLQAQAVWFTPDGGVQVSYSADRWSRWRADGRWVATAAGRPPDPLAVPVRGRRGEYAYDFVGNRRSLPVDVWPAPTGVRLDEQRFVAAENVFRREQRDRCWVVVRSLADGRELQRFPDHPTAHKAVVPVPFSPLVVVTAGVRLWVWDCDTGAGRSVHGGTLKQFRQAVAHPAGRVVAAVNNRPVVTLLDPHALTTTEFAPGVGNVTAVAVAPDGLRWAAAGDRGTVAVWDADR